MSKAVQEAVSFRISTRSFLRYLNYWYPLPFLPEDLHELVLEFCFDPFTDPW